MTYDYVEKRESLLAGLKQTYWCHVTEKYPGRKEGEPACRIETLLLRFRIERFIDVEKRESLLAGLKQFL